MRKWNLDEIRKLSPEERLQLIGDIWDTLEDDDIGPPTSGERELIDARLAELDRSPDEGSSWEEVRARLLAME